jgi:hypothetical protein
LAVELSTKQGKARQHSGLGSIPCWTYHVHQKEAKRRKLDQNFKEGKMQEKTTTTKKLRKR